MMQRFGLSLQAIEQLRLNLDDRTPNFRVSFFVFSPSQSVQIILNKKKIQITFDLSFYFNIKINTMFFLLLTAPDVSIFHSEKFTDIKTQQKVMSNFKGHVEFFFSPAIFCWCNDGKGRFLQKILGGWDFCYFTVFFCDGMFFFNFG